MAMFPGAIDAYAQSRVCQCVGRDGRPFQTPTQPRNVCLRIGARDGSDDVSSGGCDGIDARGRIFMYSAVVHG